MDPHNDFDKHDRPPMSEARTRIRDAGDAALDAVGDAEYVRQDFAAAGAEALRVLRERLVEKEGT